MSKSTLTQAPADPTTVTPTDPTAPPTAPIDPGLAPVLKGYAVKVGKDSPVATVRSAGSVFTREAQILAIEHEAMAELKNNPWLEVTEVTE